MKCFIPPLKHAGRIWDFNNDLDKPILNQHTYDVWLHHVKISNQLLKAVPKAKIIITIVRKPSDRFISAWYWYNISNQVNRISIKEFVQIYLNSCSDPKTTSININKQFKFRDKMKLDATHHELSGHLFFHTQTTIISSFLKRSNIYTAELKYLTSLVSSDHWFFVITERMDESLVILSHRLNWKPWQLLYHSQKVSSWRKSLNSSMIQLTHYEHKTLNKCQPLDSVLHTAANIKLDKLINYYYTNNNTFIEDVKKFRCGVERLQRFCSYIAQNLTSSTMNSDNQLKSYKRCKFKDAGKRICFLSLLDNRDATEYHHNVLNSRSSTKNNSVEKQLQYQQEDDCLRELYIHV
jgi:hypothetical protein